MFRKCFLLLIFIASSVLASAAPTVPKFETAVAPILKSNCISCHGPGKATKSMDLSTYAGVMKGSEDGAVVIPGKPDASSLYKKIHDGEMPKGGKPLPQELIAIVRAWIEAGAPSALTFESAVHPILQAKCVACHGPATKMGGLDLSTFAGLMHASESGPVVVAEKPDESRLYKMIRDGSMPKGGKPLPPEEIAIIREWIEAGAPSATPSVMAAAEPLTEHDILPILFLRCTGCHGLLRRDSGLDLHTRAAMLKGGKSGPALIPGKPEQSIIVGKLRSGEMPPKEGINELSIKRITPAETEKVIRWIAQGAPAGKPADAQGIGPDPLVSDNDRQFWAFQRPKRFPVPEVKHGDRVRNPVDAFVLNKLEAKGLSLSPEADKLTLIRRAAFDLTGLPPTPDDVRAFLADHDPNAYEKLIERLLTSPRYGERWGRYWLDLAGYADSEGGKLAADITRPHAWRYRDYVIRAFNADKPYDRFLLEQIAGDELMDYEHAHTVTQEVTDNLVATGFLRMGPDSTNDAATNAVEDRLDVIGDEIDILGSGVMGLTIRCARCHSHKYDPIPQRDYYRLVDVFKGAYDYYNWLMPQQDDVIKTANPTRYLPYVTPGATPVQLLKEREEREVHNSEIERQIGIVKTALEKKAEPLKKKILDQRLAKLAAGLREDLRKTIDTPPEQRTEVQKYLAEKFAELLKVGPEDLNKADPDYRRAAERNQQQVKLLELQKRLEPRIRALWDRGEPTPTYILRRGEPTNAGPLVSPGVPAVLMDGKARFEVRPPWPGANSTGRRLAFAKWLIQPDNPLTARVMANRIWAHHFGFGIVRTLGNFGHTGTPPTNSELLDWLATEFIHQGWSMKAMHRLIMTSSTYRQSSTVTPALEKLDPDNLLISRMPLRRMEAEPLYDALLSVSGRFDETRFGPPQPVQVREDGLVTPIQTDKGWRRGIYVAQRRTEIPTLLDSFDLPPMSPNCLERNNSTVAIQALHLMNNAMVETLAGFFADRLRKEAGGDPQKQIEQAYWLVLSRPPTQEQARISLEAYNRIRRAEAKSPDPGQTALASVCHGLLNSASFLYID